MLPNNYFNDKINQLELKNLILDPKVKMKAIQLKYGFSRQRLYQIIKKYNLPNKHKAKYCYTWVIGGGLQQIIWKSDFIILGIGLK